LSGAPSSQLAQIARTAWTNSRMRGAGLLHGIEKRRVTWALTCEPRPSANRPPLAACRSLACRATVIGLRAKAMVTAVPTPIRSVRSAAIAAASGGSTFVSVTHQPSKPRRSASRADSPASSRRPKEPVKSTFTGPSPRGRGR
jgi:hypothetical protein